MRPRRHQARLQFPWHPSIASRCSKPPSPVPAQVRIRMIPARLSKSLALLLLLLCLGRHPKPKGNPPQVSFPSERRLQRPLLRPCKGCMDRKGLLTWKQGKVQCASCHLRRKDVTVLRLSANLTQSKDIFSRKETTLIRLYIPRCTPDVLRHSRVHLENCTQRWCKCCERSKSLSCIRTRRKQLMRAMMGSMWSLAHLQAQGRA